MAINARAAVRDQISGVERWAQELSERLPRLNPRFYMVLRPPSMLAHRAGHLWEQIALPSRVQRLASRLLLSPANTAPIAFDCNVIVIHDALPLRHPEWYSRAYGIWYRRMTPLLVKRARRIVTVSAFSASELVEATGVDREAIVVISGGVDERFDPRVDPSAARAAFDLRRPYVLTVGGPQVRKNLRALEPAARNLREHGFEFVAAGGSQSHLVSITLPPSIRSLGYVRDDLLPGLYAGAAAFVLPSLYEGFGLPVLEAMASGVPVVAANLTALPEICNNAALLVDIDDPSAVTAALTDALDDSQTRKRLIEAGLKRAGGFSWEQTARSVDALMRKLAAEDAGLAPTISAHGPEPTASL